MSVRESAEELAAALAGGLVDVAEVTTRLGTNVNPPTVVVGPPSVEWETGCADPTSARFLLYVVVKDDDTAMEKLWDLVPQVAAVVDEATPGVVIRADPGVYPAGATELPAYVIQVQVPLS